MAKLKDIKKYSSQIKRMHESGATSPALILTNLFSNYMKDHQKSKLFDKKGERNSKLLIGSMMSNDINDENLMAAVAKFETDLLNQGITHDDELSSLWTAYFAAFPYAHIRNENIAQEDKPTLIEKSKIASKLFIRKEVQETYESILKSESELLSRLNDPGLYSDMLEVVKYFSETMARHALDRLLTSKYLDTDSCMQELVGALCQNLPVTEREWIYQAVAAKALKKDDMSCFMAGYFSDLISDEDFGLMIDAHFDNFTGFDSEVTRAQAARLLKMLPDDRKKIFVEKILDFIEENNEVFYAGRCSAVDFLADNIDYIPDNQKGLTAAVMYDVIRYSTELDAEQRSGLALHAIACVLQLENNENLIKYIQKIDIEDILKNWLSTSNVIKLQNYQYQIIERLYPYMSDQQKTITKQFSENIFEAMHHNQYYHNHKNWIRNVELFSPFLSLATSDRIFDEMTMILKMKDKKHEHHEAKVYAALELISKLIPALSKVKQDKAIDIIIKYAKKNPWYSLKRSSSNLAVNAIKSLQQYAMNTPEERERICSKLSLMADTKAVPVQFRIACLSAVEKIRNASELEYTQGMAISRLPLEIQAITQKSQ